MSAAARGVQPREQSRKRRVNEVPRLSEPASDVLKSIRCGQEQLDQFRADQERAIPSGAEDLLEAVASALDEADIHRSRGSLQAVGRPEQFSEQLAPAGAGVLLQSEKVAVHGAHVLRELAEERRHQTLDELVLVH